MDTLNYSIFFTGNDDPRDGCIIIGTDEDNRYFEFETEYLNPFVMHTTISSNQQPTAVLDWHMNGPDLGVAIIGGIQVPMEHLVTPGAYPGARRFHSANGGLYEWRRRYDDPQSYELFHAHAPDAPPIAIFRKFIGESDIGRLHGALEYSFADGSFLLEVLITLNLNRWLDLNT